jgi:hypothetical protein
VSRQFGDSAARLCSLANQLLGWRPGEFWDSTPAEMALALKALGPGGDPPDGGTIDELKRRFPD